VRSRERDGCLGGKLDLVRTFMVCIDGSALFLKVVFPSFFVLISELFVGGVLRTISWGLWWVSRMSILCLFGW
jgi:hypothetical protein